MPGYGIAPPDADSGLLPWSWATERLAGSHDYWVATVSADGHPHVMPVWGVLVDDRLMWSTSPGSRKARNLAINAAITIATTDSSQPVIVEGTAVAVTDLDIITRFATAMDAKYASTYGVEFYRANTTYVVKAIRAFGLDTDDFTGTPTRWTFPTAT